MARSGLTYTEKMKCAYHTKWCDKWHRGGANHPHYSVISTPTMSFITPFDMVCKLHFLQCSYSKFCCYITVSIIALLKLLPGMRKLGLCLQNAPTGIYILIIISITLQDFQNL